MVNDMQTKDVLKLPKPLIGFASATVTNGDGAFVVAGGVSG